MKSGSFCYYKSGKGMLQIGELLQISSLRPATLFKKRLWHMVQVFSCEFCGIFKNTFSYRIPPVATFSC